MAEGVGSSEVGLERERGGGSENWVGSARERDRECEMLR